MDVAVSEFKKRREQRLRERKIDEYRKRREARLDQRGFQLDAGEDDTNNNNNSGGGSGGSHGNGRLPFGLCMRYGIEIGADWTPRDAWDALASKGITPEGAFGRLKEGKDPGTPDEGATEEGAAVEEEATEPKKSINVQIGPDDYKVSGAKYVAGGGATGKPWVLEGSVPGYRDVVGELASFESKRELLQFLKDQGVEEFPDPETGELVNPKEMELPKEPVKRLVLGERGGAEYEGMKGRYVSWASRGVDPWRLEGKLVDGTGTPGVYVPRWLSRSFKTKTDMMRYLKKHGIEEFADPETGELVNPKEMDIPEPVLELDGVGYVDLSIGLRKGMYALIGTDYDGKKKTIVDFSSYGEVKDYLKMHGVAEDKVKTSPSMRKREKERVAWVTSDRKEYFTDDDGERYGDLSLDTDYYGKWVVTGESEEGRKRKKKFETKAEAMQYLKDQGVEHIRERSKEWNPMEFEMPPTKVTIGGRAYQDVKMTVDSWGDVELMGVDLDGADHIIGSKRYSETYGEFYERIKSELGLSDSQISIPEEHREKLEEIKKADEERERRRKEWEAKAISLPGVGKYTDVHIVKDSDGDLEIRGYDKEGREKRVSSWGDMKDMESYAKSWGVDMYSLLKDDELRKEYDDYLEAKRTFESEAVDFGGSKYAKCSVVVEDGYVGVKGYDQRGKERGIVWKESFSELEDDLQEMGLSPTMFEMTDDAKKWQDRAMKAKQALATGDYYSLGKRDVAYKDIRVEEDPDVKGMWKIIGTDTDGNESVVESVRSWDDAITKMSDYGVKDYQLKDKSGKEIGKPKWGMHRVMLMRKPGGGFLVFADSKRYGDHAIMYETPKEEEARRWLVENGVPEGSVKTRGMNPNDDVPRTHTAKSLEGFDQHRMERAEKIPFLDQMDDQTKIDTAEMLTDLFAQGEYRMRRKGHFEEIFDSHFKSLLETGTSGGSTFKDGRRATGVESFGHERDIKPRDAEKYGYLGVSDDEEAFSDDTADWYGKTIYKFKKDKVKDRVTYSFGDTLDSGRPLVGYAGDKPTIEGVSALDRWGDGKDYLDEALGIYRDYKSGRKTYSQALKKISSICTDRYIETHYHGDLTLADVDSITFPKRGSGENAGIYETFKRMTPEKRKKVLTFLRDNDVKLQYYDPNDKKVHDGFEYVEREFGGA